MNADEDLSSNQPFGWSEWDGEDADSLCDYYDDRHYVACPVTGDVWIQYTAGKGIGYPTGYTSAGLFYAPPFLRCDRLQPFVDVRVHILDNARRAVNAGLGARYLLPSFNQVIGLNVYYDFREAKRVRHDFNQIGVGFEMFGCLFDFTANGYFPVGEKTRKGCKHVYDFPGGFHSTCREQQTALTGGDFEFLTSLCRWDCYFPCLDCCCFDPYVGLGGYFYDGDCCKCRDVNGVRARGGIGLCDWLNLEVRVTHDSVFKTLVQGIFTLSYPLCIPASNCCETTCCYDYRYLRPVERQEIIPVENSCRFKANWNDCGQRIDSRRRSHS